MLRYVLYSSLLLLCLTIQVKGLRFIVPRLNATDWQCHNTAIKERLEPLHSALGVDIVTPSAAANEFTDILTEYFSEQEDFLDRKLSETYIEHEPKSLSQARKCKNALRKKAFRKDSTVEDRKAFKAALKTVSYLKKQDKQNKLDKSRAHMEKRYRGNFYDFSKNACNGTLLKTPLRPTFSENDANYYFEGKYSVPNIIDPNALNWFPYINVDFPDRHEFDTSPIKPRAVKTVLRNKKATSAPGHDGLMYGMLKSLDSVHHFLATLYNRILESGDPPESWSESKVILIHKSGDTAKAENFRMISLTSCISKVLHQILAERTTKYLTDHNSYIDKSVQKAFINGVNECTEHNTVLHEVLRHAKTKRRTLPITFFDLADAFGSVSHQLIERSMARYAIPTRVSSYVATLYSQLNGSVSGPGWKTKPFEFKRGVFQGDPLSPTVF